MWSASARVVSQQAELHGGYSLAVVASQGGAYLLQQVTNDNLGSPALEQLATVAPAAGDRLSCQTGSTLTCAVNGAVVVRTSDPFNASARWAGLAGYTGGGGSPVRFDDVLVQAPAAVPDLRVTVAAGSASAPTGAPVSWTATVANAGSGTAPTATATVTRRRAWPAPPSRPRPARARPPAGAGAARSATGRRAPARPSP